MIAESSTAKQCGSRQIIERLEEVDVVLSRWLWGQLAESEVRSKASSGSKAYGRPETCIRRT